MADDRGHNDQGAAGAIAGLVFWALVAVLAWAPLPFASNRPWASSLLAGAVGVLLVVWAAAALMRPALVRLPWRRHGAVTVLFLLAAAWFALQASPLTPASWHDPVWGAAARALGRPLAGAVSVDPVASRGGLMRLLAYAGVFWLAAQYGREPARARRLLWAVALAGAAYATYGLAVYFGGNRTVLWFAKWTYVQDLTSTFVNRNSYGAYAGLGLLAALALLFETAGRTAALGLGSRAGITHFLDHLGPAFFVLVLAGAVLASALLLSHSRGALAATAFAVVVLMGALAAGRRGRRRHVVLAAAVLALAGIGLLQVSGKGTLGRVVAEAGEGTGREAIHDLVAGAIAERPLAGRGLDTFPALFYRYRDLSIPWTSPRFDKAHSTYLELLLEGGWIGFAAVMASLAVICAVMAAGAVRRRRHAIYPCLGLAATALIGAHASLDFSIQMPAVAVTFFALLGVAFAQSWRTRAAAAPR